VTELDIIAQRSKPRLLLLDADLRIVFADWTAMFSILRAVPEPAEPMTVLPEPLYSAIRKAVSTWTPDSPCESIVEPIPDLILRVSRLTGRDEELIAVVCEGRARRDDISSAAQAFGLTKRETEVLSMVLHGHRSSEIAEELSIAETTVEEHLTQLLSKTKSRNRSEMIARVLGWSGTPGR
jgi:DNA-binding NarL/FixJ family response regulator